MRRQQNLNPNRFNNKMAPAPEHQIVESNRRYYQIRPAIDRVYGPPIGHQHIPAAPQQNSPPKRFVDGYAIQRQPQQQFPQQTMQQQYPQQPMQQQYPQQPMQQQYPQEQYPQQQMQQQYPQQQQPNFEETKPDLENEDLFRNPPQINPRPIDDNQHKIEPVVTLQMIQSKKNLQHDSFNFTTTKLINEGHIPQSHEKNPLYVVYPVKSSPLKLDVITATESNGAVVIGQRGEQPPLPPSEIGMRNDYQNTPFTIIHNEQEPILMAKQNLKPIKPQFPYQLEKVDPLTVAELDRQSNLNKGLIKEFPVDTVFNIGEAPIDAIGKVLNKRPSEIIKGEDIDNEDEYQISSTLTKVTRKPIAIAYTPTEPPPNRYYNHYGGPNFVSPANDKAPTESAYNHKDDKDENGYPSRGDHYEQDFQAPFFPSISIGGNQVTNSYEGWAVVTPQTSAQNSLNKNQINRSDEKIEQTQKESEFHEKLEITTKKFNLDSFQPEFEGGFKPIFPDMKMGDVQTRHSEVREDSPTQTEKQILVDDKKITSTSTTTTTTTTEKPVEKKTEIDSLEALFGLDDDYEYDDSTTTSS